MYWDITKEAFKTWWWIALLFWASAGNALTASSLWAEFIGAESAEVASKMAPEILKNMGLWLISGAALIFGVRCLVIAVRARRLLTSKVLVKTCEARNGAIWLDLENVGAGPVNEAVVRVIGLQAENGDELKTFGNIKSNIALLGQGHITRAKIAFIIERNKTEESKDDPWGPEVVTGTENVICISYDAKNKSPLLTLSEFAHVPLGAYTLRLGVYKIGGMPRLITMEISGSVDGIKLLNWKQRDGASNAN